ncbi:hypothetical protein RAB80_005440 [Fusarium oxysporum f. sp. vasinfectum]|uniref:FAD-binding domain-containing protein n=1 Tax=Fusarium oxysporum f. sp. vasinfectum 25433 TaxID=1089449 RepID=X0L411_FUSOX|nr:hypothetical protein FOTG_15998 [Fusarium oxysporum f. sp. vasinfectum 25433]KAK2680259.1 hypothetical protein RAB80_005440 [Fusarium oxysporum f. sp. vasinfectum]KAK2935220.1 hypothetical protein FoTM2_003161 [Fusarium oxysporum f. sp. vasinfectum]
MQKLDDQRDDEGTILVDVQFDAEKSQESISCDVLLGCDNIHSFVQTTVVDLEWKETHSGRVVAYGHVKCDSPGQIGVAISGGKQVLRDSTMIQSQHGSFLMTYFEPSREKNQDAREGWKALRKGKATLKRDNVAGFKVGSIKGLELIINERDWYYYPVYMLPPD